MFLIQIFKELKLLVFIDFVANYLDQFIHSNQGTVAVLERP